MGSQSRVGTFRRGSTEVGLPDVTAPSISVVVPADRTDPLIGEWDDLVRAHPLSDVAQLSAWTRIRELAGFDATYVLVGRGERVVGGAQVLVRRVPGFGDVGYVPYGPVVSPAAENGDEVHDTIAGALAQLGRRRFRMLFVQPPEGADRASRALLEEGFRGSDADVAPAASLHVDLRQSETELRDGLSKRLRRWTNTWEARGVTVRRGDEEDLPMLADLLAETADHHGFDPFDVEYLSAMYRELSPDNLVVFVGEVDGRPVTMTLFTACGRILKARFLGLDRSDDGQRLNVPAAVYWHAMRWAKAAGYEWFDLGGLLPESVPLLLSGGKQDLEALSGPDRFKARFGGQAFLYPPPVELIPHPVVRAGYDLARRTAAGHRIVAWAKRRSRAGDRARSSDRSPRKAWGKAGVTGFLFETVVKPPYVAARQLLVHTTFDRRYHVETSGEVDLDELGLSDPRSTRYQPSGLTRLRRVLPPREVSEDDVFIDFGSGKGRIVLQAALHYPFRCIYGVELSERVFRIAQRNLDTCTAPLRCRDVRLVLGDATTYDIPDDVTVALFNNPFVGEPFEAVITRLLESVDRRPRRLRIVYGNPVEEDVLLRTGRIRLVRSLRGWRPGREWAQSNSFRLYEVTGPRT